MNGYYRVINDDGLNGVIEWPEPRTARRGGPCLHPWGGSSGAERGTQESGGTYFAGIIAAGLTFHQETRDESPDLMLDAECVRRYLRTCGFSKAQSEEIIADARADQPSTSTTQDLVITSFLKALYDALQGLGPAERLLLLQR